MCFNTSRKRYPECRAHSKNGVERAIPALRRLWCATGAGVRIAVLVWIGSSIPVAGVAAQPASIRGPEVAVDTATLAEAPAVLMETLLEKTLFKVDVLRLRLRFDQPTTARVTRLVALGTGRSSGPSDASIDSIAAAALGSTDVWARIHFERDVSLSRFLDGVMDNLQKAERAGIVPAAEVARLRRGLPRWFGFLDERRIRDGDELWYRIRGDTLRTLYVGVEGDVLLDQTDVGAGARLAVLGGYFAPGSDLRDGLIESLFKSPREADR